MEIWIPGQVEEREPAFVCRVPVSATETCGEVFYEGERKQWERHMVRCARKHADEIEAASHHRQTDPMRNPWDPELAEHMKRVGDRMLREGRLIVKKNERAGFS